MHLYFSGIGGSGLSALAHVALDAGYHVSGSDTEKSQNTDDLAKRGAHIAFNQDGTDIANVHDEKPIDWIVVSSAIPGIHPERSFAQAHDIKLTKRDGFINFILQEFGLKLIAVSGTHGKTTTTAMVAWLALQLKQPISWVIGTNVPFGNSGHLETSSQFLVLEADEYDRHMLHYQPLITVIPSLDYDHPDIYVNKADYIAAFNQLVQQSQLTVTWESVAQKLTPVGELFRLADTQKFQKIALPGEHMRKNAWLAISTLERCSSIGFPDEDWDTSLELFQHFPGTQRRFEKLNDRLFTDYAHHPVEIAATLAQARELHNFKELVVLYQPHQNTRQHEVEQEYPQAFEQADRIYWLPTYLSREDKSLEVLTPEHFQKLIGKKVQLAEMDDALVETVKKELESDNLVIAMGAGSIDPWLREKFLVS